MQYPVPQFTDVEDRIIGPLTLKQFLILIFFGAVIFMLWSIFGIGFLFYATAVPVFGLGVFIALKKINGRPLYYYVPTLIMFVSKPRVMVFRREESMVSFSKQEVKEKEKPAKLNAEQTAGRLKSLAYLLDRKTEEERKLLDTYEKDLEKGFPDTQPPQGIFERRSASDESEEKGRDRKSQLMAALKAIAPRAKKAGTQSVTEESEDKPQSVKPLKKVVKRAARKPLEDPENKQFDPSDILGIYGQ